RRSARVLRQFLGAGPGRVQGSGREREEDEVTDAQTAIEPVHKSVVVRCSPDRAFEVFTREIGTWWPLGTHSIGENTITEVVFEEQVGGRIFERHEGGAEAEWGRVLAWEPPVRFTMSWYPGHDPAEATELEV